MESSVSLPLNFRQSAMDRQELLKPSGSGDTTLGPSAQYPWSFSVMFRLLICPGLSWILSGREVVTYSALSGRDIRTPRPTAVTIVRYALKQTANARKGCQPNC